MLFHFISVQSYDFMKLILQFHFMYSHHPRHLHFPHMANSMAVGGAVRPVYPGSVGSRSLVALALVHSL